MKYVENWDRAFGKPGGKPAKKGTKTKAAKRTKKVSGAKKKSGKK